MEYKESIITLADQIFEHTGQFKLPSKAHIHAFIDHLYDAMFPQTRECVSSCAAGVQERLSHCCRLLEQSLMCQVVEAKARTVLVDSYFTRLADVYATLKLDAQAHFDADPAAVSLEEVYMSYPGFKAIAYFRSAHLLHDLGVSLIPRVITEYAHQLTGIDIHPSAQIGPSFAIDHGTGVVVGETTNIGRQVTLYQGVTLGAMSVSKAAVKTKRHPTLEDRVKVYANATILGGTTVIGHDSVIGGNSWVTASVPPHSKVV